LTGSTPAWKIAGIVEIAALAASADREFNPRRLRLAG
jgi:hypothetical protein